MLSVPAGINWEIIVIDNASTDDTASVSQKEWLQYNLPDISFTILNEPRPRKYYALATGVENAKYEYIIICDDDNWLDRTYLGQAYETIHSNPLFGAVGGQGIAVSDKELPGWFWEIQNNYATGAQMEGSGDISAKGYLWGAGMIFRRSLYKKVNDNLPSLLLGPTQEETARAEDVELCMRFLLAGYRLYYDAKLIFSHYIEPGKLIDNYREKLLDVSEYENRILNLYRKQIQINNLSGIKRILLLCTSWLRYIISRIFPQNRKWHSVYEAEIIYLLSGFKLLMVSDEVVKMRQLNLDLAPIRVA